VLSRQHVLLSDEYDDGIFKYDINLKLYCKCCHGDVACCHGDVACCHGDVLITEVQGEARGVPQYLFAVYLFGLGRQPLYRVC